MPRVFISEYITSGAWADRPLVGSLATEGQAMLVALAEDLAADKGTQVVTSWDHRLGQFPVKDTEVTLVRSTGEAEDTFVQLAAASDRTLVIAPEIDGVLQQRCQQVADAGGTWIGCSPETLALCSDKLVTSRRLREAGLSAIETRTADQPPPESEWVVWKPRDGAGSLGISTSPSTHAAPHPDHVVQPLLSGQHVSVAVLCGDPHTVSLPVAQQHLSTDGLFTYRGGRVPCFPLDSPVSQAVSKLALDACGCIGNPCGWVGVDLLVDDENQPVILEINPRLTTSFMGYRQLAPNFALSHYVTCPHEVPPINRPGDHWQDEPIEFTSSGTLIPLN